ncbi:UDP-4-amino-4,6-dideoxy-N-acetyl-beta-L-altrosamine transaminase [Rhizobium grahamii]|uniref:UDP-4-amino-4, 6-dideoxy-N-acetyl-beta-L-altrosamine transaminase n=1 Tax=Rhizobium grahamii TaxID=1120045 RepID=A0A5Q0C7U8_9HYPH|nr:MULTISPECIES: UDP-4-amino-4,6-dideoxy-N-acetyl-beta-L-altrosamine transaminase [Rhizobium]QFY62026.1 UDP-4-amino-4,6-dideoxy-N-acetyl-beta-L-altrosamine transaminase [Rhizobium grahamii]QRM48797.1 UDP-4-amino-4,6-dideoxy-N-acetyl-beta-L-altrosamine transaminase [Rhizobium sp. BG6]
MALIPYGRQTISEEDLQAVATVLKSDFLTQGPEVPKFERVIADYCGAAHGVAVNSATSALHIACLALGLGEGDVAWTVPNTFVASANCAIYCGASVDFVDIDPLTLNMSPKSLEEKLKAAKAEGRLPKIVIPVHFAGMPCDMARIGTLAQEYGFRVIEDASHAIGASYGNRKVGSCQHSDITVFSFHPVKIITTAEGGLATTQSEELAKRMQDLRSHGITRDAARMTKADEGPWYYEQLDIGFNYRMTEIQAALGTSQAARLDEWVARRHRIANAYDRKLVHLPLILPVRENGSLSALHLYVVQVDEMKTKLTRRQVFDAMRNAGIGVNVHYIPVHTQPYYQENGMTGVSFPASEAYYDRCISLPMFASLSDDDQDYVVAVLEDIFAGGKDARV